MIHVYICITLVSCWRWISACFYHYQNRKKTTCTTFHKQVSNRIWSEASSVRNMFRFFPTWSHFRRGSLPLELVHYRLFMLHIITFVGEYHGHRDNSGHGLSQWKEALHSNASCHCQSPYPEWSVEQFHTLVTETTETATFVFPFSWCISSSYSSMPSTVHVSNIYLSSHLSLNSLGDELATGQLPKVLRDLPWQNACYPPVSYAASKAEPAVLLIKKR